VTTDRVGEKYNKSVVSVRPFLFQPINQSINLLNNKGPKPVVQDSVYNNYMKKNHALEKAVYKLRKIKKSLCHYLFNQLTIFTLIFARV